MSTQEEIINAEVIVDGLTPERKVEIDSLIKAMEGSESFKFFTPKSSGIAETPCSEVKEVVEALEDYRAQSLKLEGALADQYSDTGNGDDKDGYIAVLRDGRKLKSEMEAAKKRASEIAVYDDGGVLTGGELKRAEDHVLLVKGLHDWNPTEESAKILQAAQNTYALTKKVSEEADIERDVAVLAFETMSPSFVDRQENVARQREVIAKAYKNAEGLWLEYTRVEALCQEADCDAPTVQTIQVRRSTKTRPGFNDLAFGEIGFTETDSGRVDILGNPIIEKHFWIGGPNGEAVRLFAFGDEHTEGSLEELAADIQVDMGAHRDQVDEELSKLMANYATLQPDSILELRDFIQKVKHRGDDNVMALDGKVDAMNRALLSQAQMFSVSLQRLQLQHNREMQCVQRNLLTLDGGTFDGDGDDDGSDGYK